MDHGDGRYAIPASRAADVRRRLAEAIAWCANTAGVEITCRLPRSIGHKLVKNCKLRDVGGEDRDRPSRRLAL